MSFALMPPAPWILDLESMGIDSFHSDFIDSAWLAMTALGCLAGLALSDLRWAGWLAGLAWAGWAAPSA